MDYLDKVTIKAQAVEKALDELEDVLKAAKAHPEQLTTKGVKSIQHIEFHLRESRIFFDEVIEATTEIQIEEKTVKYPDDEPRFVIIRTHLDHKSGYNSDVSTIQTKVEEELGKSVEIKTIEYDGIANGGPGEPRFVGKYKVFYEPTKGSITA